MKNALYMYYSTLCIKDSYIYFLSLLIKKMDTIYDSLIDKEKMVTEKGRKVRFYFLLLLVEEAENCRE